MRSSDRRLALQQNVPLAPLTTLGVGGAARWFFRATSVEDVQAAHAWSTGKQCPLVILGGGSNVVIGDAGVDGLVLQVAVGGVEWADDGDGARLHAGAGEAWDDIVAASTARGLAGIECLSGIPGAVGGTPIQNIGAYGQEVSGAIVSVTAFDRVTSTVTTLDAGHCGFGYRSSRFKYADAGRFVVCGVSFALRSGPPTVVYPDVVHEIDTMRLAAPPTVRDVREAVLAVRRRKGMVIDPMDSDTRSVGSFFMNPVVDARAHAALAAAGGGAAPGYAVDGGIKVPAAWLIERAGFGRGFHDGRVGLSTKHPLAIVNRGGATAREVLALAARIRRRVFDRFGVSLRPEPAFIGLDGDDEAAYLQQDCG